MSSTTPDFSAQEQARIVAAAQDLFMERGLAPVTLPDVALAVRLPVALLERYFPVGKDALVPAVTARYLAAFQQRLTDNQSQSSNAVEEMLRLRRSLTDVPADMRSLFLRDLQTSYPAQYQQLEAVRTASVLAYMRQNLLRGQAEALYQPDVDVEAVAYHWLQQANATLYVVADAQALADRMTANTNEFLQRVTTPAGAFLIRRLQEAAPYY